MITLKKIEGKYIVHNAMYKPWWAERSFDNLKDAFELIESIRTRKIEVIELNISAQNGLTRHLTVKHL